MAYQKSKSGDTPSELHILSGELRGVSVPLTGDEIRLGSVSDCDVVLLDEHEEPSEVVISQGDDGSYRFESVVGSVRIGRRFLKNGRTRTVSSGIPIVVGNVEMSLASTLENADKSKRSYHFRTVAAICVAVLALGGAGLGLWNFSSGERAVATQPTQTTKITYVLDKAGRSQSMVAAKALHEHLDAVGLLGFDIHGDEAEHMVTVSGKLRESERARWIEAVEWFDQSYGKSVYLDAKIAKTVDEIVLPFSIEAVWVGHAPRVTLHDGSKMTVGDELPGGWVLDAVAKESVTITKDDETLDVAL